LGLQALFRSWSFSVDRAKERFDSQDLVGRVSFDIFRIYHLPHPDLDIFGRNARKSETDIQEEIDGLAAE